MKYKVALKLSVPPATNNREDTGQMIRGRYLFSHYGDSLSEGASSEVTLDSSGDSARGYLLVCSSSTWGAL